MTRASVKDGSEAQRGRQRLKHKLAGKLLNEQRNKYLHQFGFGELLLLADWRCPGKTSRRGRGC